MSKKVTIDDLMNDLNFSLVYNRLKNLALNMFIWEGLEEIGIKPRYIEQALFMYGIALFFKDKDRGFMCLKANPHSNVNVYGEHVDYYAWGYGYNKHYTILPTPEEIEKCKGAVLIRNNVIMQNTHDYIMLFTNRICDIERTTDVNVKQQKTPRIVVCDDKDLLSFKALFNQVDGNKPTIYADKSLNLNSLDVLDITAPYVADKLDIHKLTVMNEVLTFLGINNSNINKRERVNTDEVNANNESIELNAAYMLETRQKACEEINKMFDLNISVRLREVEEYEPIHTDTTGNN